MVALATVSTVVTLKRDDKFDEFWNLYPAPRRVGKAMTKSKWDAITGPTGLRTRTRDRDSDSFITLTLSATPEEIIEGLKRSRERWSGTGAEKYGWKDGGQYIPAPNTWLNRGGWMD